DTALVGISLNGWPADSPLFEGLNYVEGRRLTKEDRQGVIVGSQLASLMRKSVGHTVDIEARPFEIVGVFESNNNLYNGTLVILLPVLQELIDRPGKVSGFGVILDRGADRERVRREIEALTDDAGRPLHLEVMSAEEFVKNRKELQFVRVMAWLTAGITLVFSAFGLVNTMMTTVFERTAEIGILRAVGWRRSRVVKLILLESLLLSLVGSLLGMLGGWLVLVGLSHWPTPPLVL